jgi:predicted ATPase
MQMFLERASQLEVLEATLAKASKGFGHTVVISGEAGIGKSSLARTFLQMHSNSARILKGACEDLSIAEPLAPLFDLAREAGWDLPSEIFTKGERLSVFSQALEILSDPSKPTLVLIEDLHWADDATIDFLRYIGRRIDDRNIVRLLTSRDDEINGRSNIRRTVGSLPAETVSRIVLNPLTKNEIARLALETGLDPESIFDLTGGNAFYVTELLRSDEGTSSFSVQESILSRADKVSTNARMVLDIVSIFPRRAERNAMDKLHAVSSAEIEESVNAGLLEEHQDYLSFRHELARRAIESALGTSTRRDLNARLLEILREQGGCPNARLLHHSVAAGDRTAINEYAPRAADEANSVGALREAAEYLEPSLESLEDGRSERRLELMENFAWAKYMIGDFDAASGMQKRFWSASRVSKISMPWATAIADCHGLIGLPAVEA